MSVHRIRLRHPWLREPQANAIVWRRRFNRPTGLGPEERVFVVVEGLAGPGVVTLNDEPLGPFGQRSLQRFEVTERLRRSNELTLRLDSPSSAETTTSSTPPVEVQLEIHSAEG